MDKKNSPKVIRYYSNNCYLGLPQIIVDIGIKFFMKEKIFIFYDLIVFAYLRINNNLNKY